jgi:tetratricopeptide (TPR) repeat protein
VHSYGVRDVERLLHLSRSTIRALIAAGFVAPERNARGAWRFSFQDLIVLRTAQALAEAKVPSRRITRSIRELRRHLPDAMPLWGLSICAEGDSVVVRDGSARWQAESGQYLLQFGGDPARGALTVIERDGSADASASARQWFDQAVALERRSVDAAADAYARAIAADPAFVDARINLGRLLHEAKRLDEAERVYREAIAACENDPVLPYNLAVLLDDMGRKPEAVRAYELSLALDPDFVDSLYNLSLLCHELGRAREAIRYMSRYRTLAASRSN